MSWFAGLHPTADEMRSQRRRYLLAPHLAKKHVPRTLAMLRAYWLKSSARPFKDVWKELAEAVDVTPRGTITGVALKAAFRKYLLKIQDGRCCYCRRWLVNTAYAKPIEHILPRKHYPQFSLEFWNLAIACTDCNEKKEADVWEGISPLRRRYPRPNDFLDSFHPRFHRYDEHVLFFRVDSNLSSVIFFTGLTPQGRNLCASLLRHIAAKETLVTNNAVLAPAMTEIANFGAKAEAMQIQSFEKFLHALDQSVLRLIEQ